jgi:hypothetical protein
MAQSHLSIEVTRRDWVDGAVVCIGHMLAVASRVLPEAVIDWGRGRAALLIAKYGFKIEPR